ncbi:hypothetical protein WG622_11455 [Cognatishimia sp. D5M38]|uniref:Uncharacterized protein n=1 Tax=Cognatishimia coralii TaxID=3083254 RepID=A0ABU8QHI3_9RHOB
MESKAKSTKTRASEIYWELPLFQCCMFPKGADSYISKDIDVGVFSEAHPHINWKSLNPNLRLFHWRLLLIQNLGAKELATSRHIIWKTPPSLFPLVKCFEKSWDFTSDFVEMSLPETLNRIRSDAMTIGENADIAHDRYVVAAAALTAHLDQALNEAHDIHVENETDQEVLETMPTYIWECLPNEALAEIYKNQSAKHIKNSTL